MRHLFSTAAFLLLALTSGCKDSGTGASPKASDNANNGQSPGSGLGTIRSALSIYYGDMEGHYPQDLAALTIGGKYLNDLPKVGPLNIHPPSSSVRTGLTPTDEGGWLYNNLPANANVGNVMINCTHTDAKGSTWTAY